MALTYPYPEVQGSRFYLGPDQQGKTILVIPGSADYPTNGYPITAIELGFKLVQSAIVTGGNVTAYPASAGWYAVPVFAETQLATANQGFSGYSQFLLKVYVASTGVELAGSGQLTGAIWQVLVLGV